MRDPTHLSTFDIKCEMDSILETMDKCEDTKFAEAEALSQLTELGFSIFSAAQIISAHSQNDATQRYIEGKLKPNPS